MPDENDPNINFTEIRPDKELSREYKDSPTIENYLRLRKANPDKEIEIAITGGIEWLFANEEYLKTQGIDPEIVAGALDANHEYVSKLSLLLLEKLLDREKLEQSGGTQIQSRREGIKDTLVNYLVAMMLDALSLNKNLEIPRDLIVLVRHQLLGSGKPLLDRKLESKHTRFAVVSIAAQLLELGEEISIRKIAASLNKDHTHISQTFPGNSLQKEAEQLLEGFRSRKKSQTPFKDISAKKRID